MGRTSAAVKDRWNKEHYDRISLTVPKGWRDDLRAWCESQGETVNGWLNGVIADALQRPAPVKRPADEVKPRGQEEA